MGKDLKVVIFLSKNKKEVLWKDVLELYLVNSDKNSHVFYLYSVTILCYTDGV